MRARKLILAAASVLVVAGLAAGAMLLGGALFAGRAVAQPLPFNHRLHTQKDVARAYCHERVEKDARASIPNLAVCMGCHERALGKSAVENEVRAYAAAGREIPWVRVNRLPGHVYFSHRAHVKWGAIECAVCHGDMAAASLPPTRSQIAGLTMSRCIGCHQERQARTDCLTCHK